MKKKVEIYQLEFPWIKELRKKGSIINEVKIRRNGSKNYFDGDINNTWSLRGIGSRVSNNRK